MRAFLLRPARYALLQLVGLALAALTLVALAAADAPVQGRDQTPPAGVVVL